MDLKEIYSYYRQPLVRKEIIEYSRHRWIALYTVKDDSSFFLRYWSRAGYPLRINNESDMDMLFRRFWGMGPRTIYASVNIYGSLRKKDDVEDPKNIAFCTPIWDIDGSLDYWEKIVDVARIIVDCLEKEGVAKSVYLKWSGRGIHIHIHERAFSEEILKKYHPLDIAYSIVDYIIKKVSDQVLEIAKKIETGERSLKVENEIDLKRVFTVPLSLHKFLDLVAVCFKPDQIDDFNPDWAKPNILKHNTNWRIYEEGEADALAEKAMKEIGGYFKRVGTIRTVVKHEQTKTQRKLTKKRGAKVGRFQVMALLQAARYYVLTGDVKKAKSFGLNRAIFYAWAKYHGRSRIPRRKITATAKELEIREEKGKKMMYIGNEGAFVSDKGWFIIGDKEQLPEDFDKEIKDKIETIMPFEEAWKKAVEYVKSFPKGVLLNQQKFYEEVYKKVRDIFVDILTGKQKPPKQKSIDT